MGAAWHAKGGRSGWWRRLSFDLPCPTVVTMPNHASTSLCHPTEVRALSVRECSLLQGFPIGWEFSGTTQEKYEQIGNAVPTTLGHVAGVTIATALSDQPSAETRSDAPEPFRLVYLKSHVRTRRWYRAGTTFVWRADTDNKAVRHSPGVTDRREKSVS